MELPHVQFFLFGRQVSWDNAVLTALGIVVKCAL
uniref:Uncharacterized protein n=1 Tax=Rhizophora mucronata TaxID=61149 RepID=A0A2P2PTM7_RHIMU